MAYFQAPATFAAEARAYVTNPVIILTVLFSALAIFFAGNSKHRLSFKVPGKWGLAPFFFPLIT